MEPSLLSLVICVNGLHTKAHSMPQDKNAVYLRSSLFDNVN